MKKMIVMAGLAVVLISSGYVWAQDDHGKHKAHSDASQPTAKKAQTICPVEGGAINTNLYVDADGKRVYFCCKGCPEEFKKNPAKYISKLEKEGVTLEKTPANASAKDPTTNPDATPSQGHDHSEKKGCSGCN